MKPHPFVFPEPLINFRLELVRLGASLTSAPEIQMELMTEVNVLLGLLFQSYASAFRSSRPLQSQKR